MYEMAIEYDVPVMFHSGDTYAPTGKLKYSHPLPIDDLAVDYPDLQIAWKLYIKMKTFMPTFLD
jgi:predicted TIM-barrel fold metal-dependent hydrolase